MISEQWKELPESYCAKAKWEACPTVPGDVVFFDSFVPHRSGMSKYLLNVLSLIAVSLMIRIPFFFSFSSYSGPNKTQKPRRVIYTTYAKSSEGDFRERYYADKRKSFPPDIERDPSKKYEYKI